MSKHNKVGVVFSTNPDYQYQYDDVLEAETLPAERQKLHVTFEKKGRGGKQVTLVKGFVGTLEDMEALSKLLKNRCGVGGSVKDGEILVQGDQREKVIVILTEEGYNMGRKKRID